MQFLSAPEARSMTPIPRLPNVRVTILIKSGHPFGTGIFIYPRWLL